MGFGLTFITDKYESVKFVYFPTKAILTCMIMILNINLYLGRTIQMS
jgi:hypothetical protein